MKFDLDKGAVAWGPLGNMDYRMERLAASFVDKLREAGRATGPLTRRANGPTLSGQTKPSPPVSTVKPSLKMVSVEYWSDHCTVIPPRQFRNLTDASIKRYIVKALEAYAELDGDLWALRTRHFYDAPTEETRFCFVKESGVVREDQVES